MNGYASDLGQMVFLPDKKAEFVVDAFVDVDPVNKTIVGYDPAIEPNSPAFWAMAIRAGFVHWQYEEARIPFSYRYRLGKNRKPRTNY